MDFKTLTVKKIIHKLPQTTVQVRFHCSAIISKSINKQLLIRLSFAGYSNLITAEC